MKILILILLINNYKKLNKKKIIFNKKLNMSKVLEYTRKGIWLLGVKNIFIIIFHFCYFIK